MDKEFFMEWLTLHRGKIIGAAIGLLLGLAVILFGFFKTLLVVVFVVLGFGAGKQLDDRVDLWKMISRLWGER
ncbi:MAG: DUF2273 domain-containing protein [Firmicutes bacterium]|nr:DUF2273 domain-containing protein [Bacillota bacterium]